MQITIDTNTITDEDKALLVTILGLSSESSEKPAPTKKAAPARPAKKAASKPAPEPEEEDEDEAEAEDDDLLGEDEEEDDDEPTLESVTAQARKLLTSGQQAKVKAALAEVGASKVSELKPKQIAAFAAALA